MKVFTKDLAGAFCNPTSLTRKLNNHGVGSPSKGGKNMKGIVAGLFLAGVLVVVTALSLQGRGGTSLVAAPEDKEVTAGIIILAEGDDYRELAGSFRLGPLAPGIGPVPASSKIKTLGPIFLKPASPTFKPQSASDAPGFNVSSFSSGNSTSSTKNATSS